MRLSYLLAAAVLVIAGLSAAPVAAADCVKSGNTTTCSVGGTGGPYVPSPCEDDYYYCDDYGVEFDLDADPGPGIGLPGRPGNRPGGGGGRPGGGGGRPGGGRG